MYPWLLFGLFGISTILTAEPIFPIQSTFKIVYAIRIYQRVGSSHEQWREMTPPDLRTRPSTETKEGCTAGSVTPSPEDKSRAEGIVGQHGRLLTWSQDGTMYTYVDRDPAIPYPNPSP